jgi:hypothetical protein
MARSHNKSRELIVANFTIYHENAILLSLIMEVIFHNLPFVQAQTSKTRFNSTTSSAQL